MCFKRVAQSNKLYISLHECLSLRYDVDFCGLQCPHFVTTFGNRDGSVHTLLLCLVTVTVLSVLCYYVW